MAQINTRIILRNDSTLNWLLHEDVVLLKGEVGIEFLADDTCRVKIGDGVRPWKELGYFGEDHLIGDDETIVVEGKVISLKGFKDAQNGAHLVKNANGELAWEVPSDELELKVEDLRLDVDGLTVDLAEEVKARKEADEELQKQITDNKNTIELLTEGLDPEKIDGLKDLLDYVEEHGLEFAEVVSKLDTVEEGAQVNILDSVAIAGETLEITDKKVDIPVAGLDHLGVVKSATGANKVNIANDGTMSVNKVDVNSLVVPMGEEFILNGGSSAGANHSYASSIGNIGYASMKDAVAHADNGDVVALQNDLTDSTNLTVNSENVIIDLNGFSYTADGNDGAINVVGGKTTIEGVGAVNGTLGADNYSMAVWAKDGVVVINDGRFTNETDGSVRGTDLIYASGKGRVEINGGVFEAAKPEWTLNVKDVDYKAGTASIIVRGGSFKNFDPANNTAEGPGTNFVDLGYQSVKEGDYYVVKPL